MRFIELTMYKTGFVAVERIIREWTLLWKEQPQHIRDEIGQIQFETFLSKMMTLVGSKATENVSEVSKLIKHALLARLPKRRYVTGIECNISIVLSHLPTIILDWMFMANMPILRPMILSKKEQ
eukprot:TCONS_00058978-protein